MINGQEDINARQRFFLPHNGGMCVCEGVGGKLPSNARSSLT